MDENTKSQINTKLIQIYSAAIGNPDYKFKLDFNMWKTTDVILVDNEALQHIFCTLDKKKFLNKCESISIHADDLKGVTWDGIACIAQYVSSCRGSLQDNVIRLSF